MARVACSELVPDDHGGDAVSSMFTKGIDDDSRTSTLSGRIYTK